MLSSGTFPPRLNLSALRLLPRAPIERVTAMVGSCNLPRLVSLLVSESRGWFASNGLAVMPRNTQRKSLTVIALLHFTLLLCRCEICFLLLCFSQAGQRLFAAHPLQDLLRRERETLASVGAFILREKVIERRTPSFFIHFVPSLVAGPLSELSHCQHEISPLHILCTVFHSRIRGYSQHG